MNKVTKNIMSYLGCTAEYAWKIQEQMMIDGVDFSECTRREFESAIVDADLKFIHAGVNPFDTIEKKGN